MSLEIFLWAAGAAFISGLIVANRCDERFQRKAKEQLKQDREITQEYIEFLEMTYVPKGVDPVTQFDRWLGRSPMTMSGKGRIWRR